MQIDKKLAQYVEKGLINQKIVDNLAPFYHGYLNAFHNAGKDSVEGERLLLRFLDLVVAQLKNPSRFQLFHQSVHHPIDYYRFGLDFIRPLINFKDSKVYGYENVDRMIEQVRRGENVILLANHQIEPDPQIINLLMGPSYEQFASNIIFVAGHRVIEDPMAIPFSMGCNLLCIYSKRHILNPPEDKSKKIAHNQRTMKKMKEILQFGGKCIYIAPSGGRDRLGPDGKVDVSPFDADSVEMIRLIAQQAEITTHFYPLALYTYHLLPPPPTIGNELGEQRPAAYSPAFLAFGSEIDMENFPGSDSSDKKTRREKRAQFITNLVKDEYSKIR